MTYDMRYAEDESLLVLDVFFEVKASKMTTVDLVGSRLLDLTADDADMRRYAQMQCCDLRPSVSLRFTSSALVEPTH